MLVMPAEITVLALDTPAYAVLQPLVLCLLSYVMATCPQTWVQLGDLVIFVFAFLS